MPNHQINMPLQTFPELSVEPCKVIEDFWQAFKDSSVRLKRKKKEKKKMQTETLHISKDCWFKLLCKYSFLCSALWEEFIAVIWDFPFYIFLSLPSVINTFTDLLLPPSNPTELFQRHMSFKIIAKIGHKNGLNSPDSNFLFKIRVSL